MNGKLSTPIKVVMLMHAYLPIVGGAEKQVASLAPLLISKGVEINVITRQYPGLARFEMVADVPVYRLPAPGPKPFASLTYSLMAIQLIRKLRPDVIHAHDLLSPTTTAFAAKRLFGIPVVAKVLRGGELGDIKKLNHRLFGKSRLKIFRKNLDAFIVISREIEHELIREGIPLEKQRFIPNGVDIHKYKPVTESEKDKLRKILNLPTGQIGVFAGRLSPEKRVDQLLKLWPCLRSKFTKANLVILGTGPQKEELKDLAGPGVYFWGNVEDVSPYLQAADFFVLPSSTEGLSNALLEAMSSGLPVIATRVGGAEDVVDHQKNGWLILPDEPSALIDALSLFLEDSKLRIEYGKNARKKMIQDYALEKVAAQLRELYVQVTT